jgi:hypothetical protein
MSDQESKPCVDAAWGVMSCTIHSDCGKGIVRPEFTTEGAECVKAYDEYAQRVIGISTPAEPESLWIKQAYLESTGEPRRRSFLARLADSVRGRK